jgi:hypothetical protein
VERRFFSYCSKTAHPGEINDFILDPTLLVLFRDDLRAGTRYPRRGGDSVMSPDTTRGRRNLGGRRGYRMR